MEKLMLSVRFLSVIQLPSNKSLAFFSFRCNYWNNSTSYLWRWECIRSHAVSKCTWIVKKENSTSCLNVECRFVFSPAGQPANGQTVGDLVTTTANNNGPPAGHGTPTGANHPIQTLGGHRLPMMPPPGPGMQFRPPFVHPHMPGAPPFFPHPPGGAIHGDRYIYNSSSWSN